MQKTVHATYDGEVFRPDSNESVKIKPNTRVLVMIETPDKEEDSSYSSLDLALSMNLDGPPDLSERFEDYLYGKNE